MAARSDAEALRKKSRTFASKKCSELSYRISVSKETFDVGRFSKTIGPSVESHNWRSVTLVPQNPKVTDYHLHVYWKSEDGDPSKIRLQIDLHAWESETQRTHKTLFAEDFFDWTGQFFQNERENAHVHAEFEYPEKQWQTRILVLPIKVPFDDKTAEINGLSINLPTAPQGVQQVWLSRGTKSLTLQLYGDRSVQFKGFTPYSDIDAFSSVVKSLIEEKKL